MSGVDCLTANLLGPVAFDYNGKRIQLPNRKAQAILAYLALNPTGSERRERLADLLWSDAGPDNSRGSLRRALFELRHALEDVGCEMLDAGSPAVALRRTGLSVDVVRVIEAVEAGEVPDTLLRQSHLSETLLAGLDVLDDEFTGWLTEQRQALHHRLLSALTAGFSRAGPSNALRRRMAEATLLLDPTNEEACRLVMRCAAEEGDAAAALRIYDSVYRLLGDEHDMEPAAETQELLARIKLGHFERPRLTDPDPGGRAPPRLAVLPFRILGPDPVPIYFADGLVEDIVCMFAALHEPVVISSNSTRALRDHDLDVVSVGITFSARYVVCGAFRRAGTRLRLSAELVEAATGEVLWKQNFDTEEARIFDAHDHIVARVVHCLAPRVQAAELRRISRMRPENVGAYHLLLQARESIFALERTSFDRAGELLNEAISLDPGYANTHVALSSWCSLRLGQGWSPDPAADARMLDSAARTAIRRDPGNAHAMAMLGHYRTLLEQDYTGALTLFDKALAEAPNDATVLTMSSPTFAFMGQPAEALRRAERALSLSPQDSFAFRIHHFLSIAHYFSGNYAEAEHWGRESSRQNPNYTSNLRLLACILVERGKLEEARTLAARAMALQPSFRVQPAVARYPSLDEARRRMYGNNLIAAGIPP
jgi:DNA-binding SARP family transcriptional activator/TolB-like protein/predicted Zn-dependent protease